MKIEDGEQLVDAVGIHLVARHLGEGVARGGEGGGGFRIGVGLPQQGEQERVGGDAEFQIRGHRNVPPCAQCFIKTGGGRRGITGGEGYLRELQADAGALLHQIGIFGGAGEEVLEVAFQSFQPQLAAIERRQAAVAFFHGPGKQAVTRLAGRVQAGEPDFTFVVEGGLGIERALFRGFLRVERGFRGSL